jgi:hypothetical protein
MFKHINLTSPIFRLQDTLPLLDELQVELTFKINPFPYSKRSWETIHSLATASGGQFFRILGPDRGLAYYFKEQAGADKFVELVKKQYRDKVIEAEVNYPTTDEE